MKHDRILPLLLLTLFSFAVKAQTNVSGFISANTTWNLAGSPYIVVGNALLSTGYTLTIKPGVVVKFDSATVLQIDGTLIAIGASDARITFTSNQPSPAPGDWGKLHFSDTCVSAVFDTSGNYVSGTIMEYCDVLYGGGIGFGEIHIEDSSPYLSNCNILNSSQWGIYSNGSNFLIDSSSIKNCVYGGLYYYNYTLHECSVIIKEDSIENNGTGISMSNPTACPNQSVKIENNYIASNSGSGITLSYAINSEISDNYFTSNSSAGSSPGIVFLFSSNVLVQCNNFFSNKGTVIYGEYPQGLITNNLFDSNINTSHGTSVYYTYQGDLNFRNNIVRNNISLGYACISFDPVITKTPSLLFDHNEFQNNTASSTIDINGIGTNTGAYNYLYLKFNNFLDQNQLVLNNLVPYGDANIYADSNYWSTTNTQHIDSAIYDYFDYGNLSVVYYQPILTAPVAIDTTCSASVLNGIKIVNQAVSSTAFPNPFSSSTEVKFTNELQDAEVAIYNVFGQRMRSIEHFNGNDIRIERGNLSSGIYIYEIIEKQIMVANGKLVVD